MNWPTLDLQPILEADFEQNPQALRHAIRAIEHNFRSVAEWSRRRCMVKSTTIDFGAAAVAGREFSITDGEVRPQSRIVCAVAYEAPFGRTLADLQANGLDLKAVGGDGRFTLYARALGAAVSGPFVIDYVHD